MQLVGKFEVTSGTMVVSDPCYDRPKQGEACPISLVFPARIGTWKAEVERDGNYVSSLKVSHVLHEPKYGDRYERLIGAGVDSGQLGFFEGAEYPDEPGDYHDGGFYSRACECTEDLVGIMGGFGVVSSTGHGDGCYDVVVHRNGSGEVVCALVEFMPDEDEEEDDSLDEDEEEDEEEELED